MFSSSKGLETHLPQCGNREEHSEISHLDTMIFTHFEEYKCSQVYELSTTQRESILI